MRAKSLFSHSSHLDKNEHELSEQVSVRFLKACAPLDKACVFVRSSCTFVTERASVCCHDSIVLQTVLHARH